MNNLSWFIYAAELSGSVGSTAWLVFLLGLPAGVASVVVRENNGAATWDEQTADHKRYPSLYKKPEDERPPTVYPFRRFSKALLIGAAVGAIVGTLAPSKNTLYAIAASELGEQALKSATATKAIKALDAWLDKQIAK